MTQTNPQFVVQTKRPTPTFPQWVSRHALLLIFIVLVGVLALFSPSFRTTANLINIVEQQSIIGIVACGMLLMILLGGFDLSVGAVGAAASVLAAWTMSSAGIVPGVLAAIGLGAVIGLINGVLIAKVRINPFVVTLGKQTLVTGLLFVGTGATPVYGVPEDFTVVGLGRLGIVPVAALIYAAVALGVWALLRFTVFGHHVYAVGGAFRSLADDCHPKSAIDSPSPMSPGFSATAAPPATIAARCLAPGHEPGRAQSG